jgi:DNA-directed RNA polymerase subunit beta'
MGHIELATPVAHIWFLRGVPSRMSILMGVPISDLEKVIYFAGYIIMKVNEDEKAQVLKDVETEFKSKVKTAKDEETKEKLKELLSNIKKEIGEIHEGKVLSEIQYHHYSLKYGACFEAAIGAEAVYTIFKNIDLKKLLEKTEAAVEKASSIEREKLQKRIGLIRSMHNANLRPEWMFMTAIPIIPPALRPMVALEGGRHATSDVNDLYRRVINRNNRLKKLKEIGAPDVILRNEKRILQEAVDALLDNSITSQGDSQAMSQSQRRALKSLSDNLKSKQGLFRQNLLGKRVDYSARSVIVVGPTLRLDQCGLPKHMALELFRPFVISKLVIREHAHNVKGANRLIEEGAPEVWAILEEAIEGKYVMLNRAPTLHRLGIQAFHPVLIEGNAIQVHPLVCSAYNADFDGDQMAVYLSLSDEAQQEAKDLMAANKNLLKPQNGDPIVSVKLLDIALGCYWMTKAVDGEKGEGKIFASPNQAILAYDYGEVSFRAKVKVLGTEKDKYSQFEGKPFETSVGRLKFNSILPSDLPYINDEMSQKRISALVDELIYRYGIDATPPILDKIKTFGYTYITRAGITWGIDNVRVPSEKKEIIARGRKMEEEVLSQYNDGLLSQEEKYRKVIEIWDSIKIEIEKVLPATLEKNGSVEDMLRSGARGSMSNLTQMAGMKGLIVNTAGRTIDFPIVPSYKEGLSPVEYFITTHGARKGLADTALNTAKAGYLTRRLVVVAQDVMITEEDCGTREGKLATADTVSGIAIPLSKNIRGRVVAADIKDTEGKVLYKAGSLITKEDAVKIEHAGIKEVLVRTPFSCKTVHGLCRMCYGLDLGRNHMVNKGEAVGIIAAQAIGEPGTQLTLRTFHAGGVAGVDITQGLPRIEEIFERRSPRNPAVVSETEGEVVEIRQNGKEKTLVVLSETKVGKSNTIEYVVSARRTPTVKVGSKIAGGDLLTDGSADITDIFKYGGKEKAEKYIIDEIIKVYELQGASISKKHIEIIVRQMFSRRKVKDPGDTTFSPGEVVENVELVDENTKVKVEGGKEATADQIILGISEASLNTQSWLAAASFQNTNRVLIANAVKGGEDRLRGLMENVIIGRLIPAGTGFGVQHVKKIPDTQTEE